LVLRVDGEGTSENALSEKGAERLLGKGHLAARLEGEDGTITGQVPYVSPDRIAAMVHAIEKQWAGHGQ
jgi:S-DNA-T family DNA segregation ATPase FtsK/SpoIIIE